MYDSTISLNSALDGGVWSTPHLSRFTLGTETLYPLCRRRLVFAHELFLYIPNGFS
jgi:hypothetical protein